jgi:carboxyl-terminal processing protease
MKTMKKITFKKKIILPIIASVLLFTASSFKSDFFEITKQIEIFTTLFKELNMNYVDETNPAELIDYAIKGMLTELDPYTQYYNEQDVEASKIRNSGEYSGIGALVRRFNEQMIIIEPYKGYPADEAGLKAGDEIIKVGDIVIADFKEETSELLKGANNSSINITYKRQGKEATTTLNRSDIEIDAVPFYELTDNKVGYIVLAKFNKKAYAQTKEAVISLKEDGAEKIVLDLRNNPGGLLNEAINIVNLFVDKGQNIVTTKSHIKKYNKVYTSNMKPLDTQIPLIVLVNDRSASASEIVAGALQDLDRAVVLGTRSFGKGLVQRPKKLTYGTQLKVTISRYYTPSGRCIQALDYWNRDALGNATRTKEKDYQAFKTKGGRTVYDGGGIAPDLEVSTIKTDALVRSLISNNVIFDFATSFYYNNPDVKVEQFSLSDADYSAFKSFVANKGIDYETNTEKQLKQLLEAAENEQFDMAIQKEYENMLATIANSKLKTLDTYKAVIKKELTDEIIKRYVYREGLYEYHLDHDDAIKTATALFANTTKFEGILN